jgi:hypothetical protein
MLTLTHNGADDSAILAETGIRDQQLQALHDDNARLRYALSRAIEELQIMQEELQAAHDELARVRHG